VGNQHHHGGDFTVGHKTSTATVTVVRVNKNSGTATWRRPPQGERRGATGMSNCPKSIRLDVSVDTYGARITAVWVKQGQRIYWGTRKAGERCRLVTKANNDQKSPVVLAN
jgi:hypothetical protein